MWLFWWLYGSLLHWWNPDLKPGWDRCPFCLYDKEEFRFTCTYSGRTNNPYSGDVRWFEGWYRCRRCRHKWFGMDSS
jgi:hypothetical protein